MDISLSSVSPSFLIVSPNPGDLLPPVLTYFSGAQIDRLYVHTPLCPLSNPFSPIQAIVTLGILLPLSCTPLITVRPNKVLFFSLLTILEAS